jgi:methionyl-tRNA formyltransferase
MRSILVGALESTRIALHAMARTPGWTPAAVITLPKHLRGRHSNFVDLEEDAAARGIPLSRVAHINGPDSLGTVRELAPDFIFVIGWSQICGPEFRAAARLGVIGFHPTALPRMRGRSAIPWTILQDEKITASTLFWIDESVDTGPILVQRFFHVAPDETASSLSRRHRETLDAILSDALGLLAVDRGPRIEQDERFATYCAKRTPDDGRIDWRLPAGEVLRLIRAVAAPYPGAFTSYRGARLTVWSAQPWAGGDAGRYVALPGQVLYDDESGFIVRCGDGRNLQVTAWELTDEQNPHRRPGNHSVLGS